MNKSNIFNYATSELSQDVIICYILEYAKEEYKDSYKDEHILGKNILNGFIKNHNELVLKFDNLSVECKDPISMDKIPVDKDVKVLYLTQQIHQISQNSYVVIERVLKKQNLML